MHPYLNIAIKAARSAGNIIARSADRIDRIDIATKKNANDLVTSIDRAAEEEIINIIKKAYPDHGFFGEESGIIAGTNINQVIWIIDPLDGTLNFVHGFPQYSVSIGVQVRGVIEHGVVYDPISNELFTASKGSGAQLNDRRIRVSDCKNFGTALIGAGFAYKRTNESLEVCIKRVHDVLEQCGDLRRPGSAALDLAYVAAGRLDGFWEVGLSAWDVAAGLEFTGGTQIELRFTQAVSSTHVHDVMQGLGFSGVRVQLYGSTQDVLVRAANTAQTDPDNSNVNDVTLQQKITTAFKDAGYEVQVRKIEYIGSEVGQQLAEQGAIAVIVSILATMAYIAIRFEYRFALSAALALAHDALCVLGIFVLFQVEFDLAALAGVLAVVGYSLNDKIVVFDRVRENFRMLRGGSPEQIMDGALNQTLSRTIMTSFMTMLVVLALLIFGGSSLFSFSLALCVGIAIGTYSSIFVASALAILLGLSRTDLLPQPKVVVDNRP